mgnify:CR=1 FL=1
MSVNKQTRPSRTISAHIGNIITRVTLRSFGQIFQINVVCHSYAAHCDLKQLHSRFRVRKGNVWRESEQRSHPARRTGSQHTLRTDALLQASPQRFVKLPRKVGRCNNNYWFGCVCFPLCTVFHLLLQTGDTVHLNKHFGLDPENMPHTVSLGSQV